jgi:hypothetical protein
MRGSDHHGAGAVGKDLLRVIFNRIGNAVDQRRKRIIQKTNRFRFHNHASMVFI